MKYSKRFLRLAEHDTCVCLHTMHVATVNWKDYRYLKKNVRAAVSEGKSWQRELSKILVLYRASPHPVKGKSPSMLSYVQSRDPYESNAHSVSVNYISIGTRSRASVQGPVSRKSRELFGPEKPVIKLQSAFLKSWSFNTFLNVRKTKRIAKSDGIELRCCDDT